MKNCTGRLKGFRILIFLIMILASPVYAENNIVYILYNITALPGIVVPESIILYIATCVSLIRINMSYDASVVNVTN